MNTQNIHLSPDVTAIRAHVTAWVAPFLETEFDDGLIEIAYTAPGDPAVERARLFSLDEIEAVVGFAAEQNTLGSNIYIGAALRTPDADRSRRASALDFYAAAFACAEADSNAEAVAARIEAMRAKGAIHVRTGQTPDKRVHHWLRLRELCDDPESYGEALAALVAHVGADAKVKDSARVLRLGGTVNWITDPRKAAKGYVDEITTVTINEAPAVDLHRLTALEPMLGWAQRKSGGGGGNGRSGEITRNAEGKVEDGREALWRQLVMAELARFQRKYGADPTATRLFEVAFDRFVAETVGDDRWNCPRGQAMLHKRADNTLRRLRSGHLARFGLYSFETDVAREEAEAAQAERDRNQLPLSGAAEREHYPDLSHDALALDLGARSWDQDARYVALWGKWLFWTGTRWAIDNRLEHLTRTRDFLRRRAEEVVARSKIKMVEATAIDEEFKAEKLRGSAKDATRYLRNKTTVVAVEGLARANKASVARAQDFDADRMLLGTPGGTVDLRTGTLRHARREDMLSKLTVCAPANGTPTRWLAFLREVFDGDAELISFMQRAAGYALTGETREHRLLFLYGTGRNGKSVFLEVLTHIWADYARRVPATTFLHSQGERHPTDIASLQGARLAVGSELPKGKTWDDAVIKDLTGGEKMTARFMRQDFFEFEPQLTLMIAGNNMPSFRGVDEAIRARVVLVPFTVTIPPERRDRHLADKLKAEAPHILRWAIDGALEWQCRGLDVPPGVAAASSDYFDSEDVVGLFLADEIEREFGAFSAAKDLSLRFNQWCEGQGLATWTQNTLVKELRGRGFQDAKSNGQRGLKGLRLRLCLHRSDFDAS
jgi:P4 family phage/plasmid primase-like protien